jgi:Zn-dependent protease
VPDANVLVTGGVQMLILLFGVSLHEAAHAWTASRLGDPTASTLGRGSLNPLRHVEIFGSLLLPVLLLVVGAPLFGWARPTPVLVKNLRRPRRDLPRIALAGPIANLALAGAGVLALAVAVQLLGPDARQVASLCLLRRVEDARHMAYFPLLFTLVQFASLNAFLAVFNLMPLPPLDGGQVLLNLLPLRWARPLARIRPFGLVIVMALAMLNVLTLFMVPIYLVMGMIIQL